MAAKQKKRNILYEEKLQKSISKSHSIAAFLQSYGIDIILYGSVFFLGFRKVGPVWTIPPILALVLNDIWSYWREQAKLEEVIEKLRDEDNDLILSDVNQLPAWVHYPDIDRCSWLNKLALYMWPYICWNVTEQSKAYIKILSKHAPGLKILKVSLGTIPPMISGVRVYSKKVSSNLLIETHLCYSGDSELKFSYLGLPGGVKNIQIRGPARIEFMLMETPPFVRGVEFSFLDHPEIDFSLTGLGSLGFTEETLRAIIDKEIYAHLVFPKSLISVWNEGRQDILQDPEGLIRVNVVEAKNLENKDAFPLSKDNSDPYVEVSYGSKILWSRIVENTSNPQWDLWCEFVKDSTKTILIKVMDKDSFSDDFIGSCSLSVSDIEIRGKIDSWFGLQGSKGSIHIKACFLKISAEINDVLYPPPQLSFLSCCILIIRVVSAQNLMLARSPKKPSSKVQLTVGNDTQETETVENDENPVFGESYTFFVNNPNFNKLKVKVVDDTIKEEIGSFTYSLRKLLDRKGLEIADQHFPLNLSASECTLVVSMRLRIIKNFFFK